MFCSLPLGRKSVPIVTRFAGLGDGKNFGPVIELNGYNLPRDAPKSEVSCSEAVRFQRSAKRRADSASHLADDEKLTASRMVFP
jgi:hypothetical protein